MLDRKLIKNFDFVLFTLAILISIIGVIVITSACCGNRLFKTDYNPVSFNSNRCYCSFGNHTF